jgi:polyhydroxybutyrate depolymerase
MSYELACHLGSRIAAVASVCGSMENGHPGACRPTHPTPVIEIHGTGDTNVTCNGGSCFVSIPTVLNYWVQANGCNPTPVVTLAPDSDPSDNSTAEHSGWRGPCVGAVVEHFRITNGGHVWPGGPLSSTDVVNRDISASQEVWGFLRRYRLSRLTLAAAPTTPLPNGVSQSRC